MRYTKKRNNFYMIVNPNECWDLNVNTGVIRKITNGRQIEAIAEFEESDKDSYLQAHSTCLKISKQNFKLAV